MKFIFSLPSTAFIWYHNFEAELSWFPLKYYLRYVSHPALQDVILTLKKSLGTRYIRGITGKSIL
jgi:hypothetical protein